MGRLAPKRELKDDECPACADFWDNHVPSKPRQKLVKIGSTSIRKLAVLACPYCDGERAISLSKTTE